jgi:hypothetical protein
MIDLAHPGPVQDPRVDEFECLEALLDAMFPWRTSNGEEASAYDAAGTAQYDINADIMDALRKYVLATGDKRFLRDCGARDARRDGTAVARPGLLLGG